MDIRALLGRVRSLKSILKDESVVAAALDKAGVALLNAIDRRVFIDGLATNGQQIGTYSTRPMYASPEQYPAFSGKLRPAKGRKSVKFPNGYKQFRKKVGRQAERVTLFLTGKLRKSMSFEHGKKQSRIKFTGFERRVKQLEQRYQTPIFTPTDSEIELFVGIVKKELLNEFFEKLKA